MAAWVGRAGEAGWVAWAFGELHAELAGLRQGLPPAAWASLRGWLRGTEMAAAALEDPFTAHGWDRPRGIPGDAVMLGFIEGEASLAPLLARATPLGRELHAMLMARPWAEALRERRLILARLVAKAAGGRVATLGAAHLREAALLADPELPRSWLALDEDAAAVEEVARAGRKGVVARRGGADVLFDDPRHVRGFDLVVCARPLEALDEAASRALVVGLFRLVAPGGRLVACVPLAGAATDAGYLDALAGWPLRLREDAWANDLAAAVPASTVAALEVFQGANGALGYAVLRKAG